MTWRWRKIFSIGGGFRSNVSRRGIGWSWGIPGFRIGRNADGSKWISIGIPGTGFYFIKRLPSASLPKDDEQIVRQDKLEHKIK